MATQELDTVQVEVAALDCNVQQPTQLQPLGEFMALHTWRSVTEFAQSSSAMSNTSSDRVGRSIINNNNNNNQTAMTTSMSREDEATQEEKKAEDIEAHHDNEVANKKQKKRVRYLRDTDRHNIIKRIENGEKQAALAREYGVTRAAICHIKKNREEIITRYDLLIKQTQEIDRAENFTDPPGEELMVKEIRSSSVLLLMTTLRDRRSGPTIFRRAAGRLIM